jgi:hypothetical protein
MIVDIHQILLSIDLDADRLWVIHAIDQLPKSTQIPSIEMHFQAWQVG